MSADTSLETRIAEGDLHFLDGLVLLGTIASQRWFGGKSRDVLDARVLDAGVPPEGPPFLALAIVEVRYGLQTHDLYHLPLGFRPSSEGWSEAVIAETEGWVAYDAIADPELDQADRRPRSAPTRSVDTDEATIVFNAGRARLPDRGRGGSAPMGAEQSNSSVVLDEGARAQALPPDRAGGEPGARGAPLLTPRDFEHIAALRAPSSYEGRPLDATLGDPAGLRALGVETAGCWRARSLGSGDSGWLPAHAARLGEVTALLHNALGLRSDRPALRARGAELRVARAALGVDRRGDRAGLLVPARHRQRSSPSRGRGEEVRDRLRAAHAHRPRRQAGSGRTATTTSARRSGRTTTTG